jgi:hypothetical protein
MSSRSTSEGLSALCSYRAGGFRFQLNIENTSSFLLH